MEEYEKMERVEIALVKDEKKPSITWHDDYISVICEISEQNIHELAVLKEYLEKVGIMVNAVRYPGTDILSFSIHKETYEKVVNRNAGRKKDYHMDERYKSCTVAQLDAKMKTMKKQDIINELGCPKMTFYRILKNIDWDAKDMSIWHFTS